MTGRPGAGDGGRAAARFFFMHVPKTAGTSFTQHIRANFAPERTYPSAVRGPERHLLYTDVSRLMEMTPEQLAAYDIFVGHLPYLTADVVAADHTLVILREPVARAVSMLRQMARRMPGQEGRPLEEIYEDEWLRALYLTDHQVRQFAMSLDDHNPEGTIDDARFQRALERLDAVSVLGLTERYDEFVAEVVHRFGWTCGPEQRLQVGDGAPVPDTLLRRIEQDNAADIAFYDEARIRHERRAASRREHLLP